MTDAPVLTKVCEKSLFVYYAVFLRNAIWERIANFANISISEACIFESLATFLTISIGELVILPNNFL